MKIVFSFLLTVVTYTYCFSQAELIKVALRDTINLRGFISYSDGTPAKNLFITCVKYPRLINSRTDDQGYFELKPCLPFDTLRIDGYRFAINSSRFVNFTIAKHESQISAEIVGKRIYPKQERKLEYSYIDPHMFDGMVHALPSHPGGLEVFVRKTKTKINYPRQAIENNISGEVVFKFTVDTNGIIVNTKLIKGIGYGCDEEVKNAILNSEKWNPGVKHGLNYEQNYYFNYLFKLED